MYFACSNLVHQLHERKLTHNLHICCTPNENIHSNYFRSHVLCLLESRAPTTRKETHLAPLPQTFPFISFPLSILTTYACPQKKRLFSLLPIFTTSFITSTPTHPTSSKDAFSRTQRHLFTYREAFPTPFHHTTYTHTSSHYLCSIQLKQQWPS